MKHFGKLFLIILICMSLASCKKKELKDDIYVFFTSDVHCGVDEGMGLDGLKALVDETKSGHDYVTLADCGDFVQGAAIGTLSKGELIVDLMNAAGYDIVTFGNHEFDYGMSQLSVLMDKMEFETVLCNAEYTGKKENIFADVKPYTIKDYDGHKVAFIGVLTPLTITGSTPGYFMEDGGFVYGFCAGEDGDVLAARLQETVDAARKEGADQVVVLSHLGTYGDTYDAVSLIAKTNGIDVVLDGHSHSVIVEDRYPNKDGQDVVLSSVGTKLQTVGELILGKDGSITALHIDVYDKKDEVMTAKIAESFAQLETILNETVTVLDHSLPIADEEGIRMVRSRETPMSNFVADAYRQAMGTQIGLINGGAVRAGLSAGEVKYADLLKVAPFQNELASCRASGQQIIDALEFSVRMTEGLNVFDGNAVGENGAFLHPSGLRYTVDTSIPSAVVVNNDGMFTGYDGEQRRVKDVMVEEEGGYVPIDPEKQYSVASINYVLFERGDGNTVFADCEPIVEHGLIDVNALIDYAVSLGTLEGKYTGIEGRIIVE
ncbi:MAG: bifunctional metallophosphatase/5'-nucleotidase [Erysipelotrichaceae bacterium]|nr:bifunctional metallophosphatase/5'-nucleotidase [Erysipelotrichaceae bacterium]